MTITLTGTSLTSLNTALAAGSGIVVSGVAGDLTDDVMTALETNQSKIASLELTGTANVSLTGSKVTSYKDVILKLTSAKLDVADTAAGIGGANFASLDAVYSKIHAITVSDSGPVSVAYSVYSANSNEQGLETLIGSSNNHGVAVTNFSGNSAALSTLISDSDIKTIVINDSIANLSSNATAINGSSKIVSSSITVTDTLVNINDSAAKTLVGTTIASKVSSVTINMAAADVTSANLQTIYALPDAIKSKVSFNITGSAPNSIAVAMSATDVTTGNLAVINALPDAFKSKVNISISDNIANLTASSTLINSSSRIGSNAITVTDTLANISASAAKTLIGSTLASKVSSVAIAMDTAAVTSTNLQTIFSLPETVKSKVTFNITGNSTGSIPVAMAASDVTTTNLAIINALPDGFKSNLSITITGSGTDLVRNAVNITALGSKVSSITGTAASIANLTSLSSLKGKFTSVGIADFGANLIQTTSTDHTALGDAITAWTATKISSIKVSAIPSSIALTSILTTASANSITVSVSDTAANLNKDLAATNSVIGSNAGNLLSVAVTDGTALKKSVLYMSNTQYTALKDKLSGQNTFILSAVAYGNYTNVKNDTNVMKYSIQDSYSQLASVDLSTLLSDTNLMGLKITGAAVADVSTINSQYLSLTIGKSKLNAVTVTDTAANLLGNATTLATLRNNNLVKNIYATGASIANITTLKSNPKVSGITVSDTDANFKLATNASLVAYSRITGFSLTGVATASLTGTGVSNYLTNSKITSIDIADNLTNINGITDTIMGNAKLNQITANSILITNIAAMAIKPKVTSINVSDSWTNIKNYFADAGANGGGTRNDQNTKVKSFTITS